MANQDDCSGKSSSSSITGSNLKAIGNQCEPGSSARTCQYGVPSATSASQRVLSSHSILPLILDHLKDDEMKSWKKAFVPLLDVSRCFFQCGADVLWNTMDNLVPVFKLLPWYKKPYEGLGSHIYSSSVDWKRFETYAPRIRSSKLRAIGVPTFWLLQMLMLPGRPDPFFPGLQAVHFGPSSTKALTVLSIFVGPSLRSLRVEEEASSALTNALAVLPMLSSHSPGLKSIVLSGPLATGDLIQLAHVSSITSLELKFSNSVDLLHLIHLRQLPLLTSLSISVPPLAAAFSKPSERHDRPL